LVYISKEGETSFFTMFHKLQTIFSHIRFRKWQIKNYLIGWFFSIYSLLLSNFTPQKSISLSKEIFRFFCKNLYSLGGACLDLQKKDQSINYQYFFEKTSIKNYPLSIFFISFQFLEKWNFMNEEVQKALGIIPSGWNNFPLAQQTFYVHQD